MTLIQDKAGLREQLGEERKRLIAAIQNEIADTANKDANVSTKVVKHFSEDVLKDGIQLVIVLGGTQYYWLCYWREAYGGAYVYDQQDNPSLKDVGPDTQFEKITEIIGFTQSRLLYSEKVAREWAIQTTYTDCASKPVAGVLIGLYQEQQRLEAQKQKKERPKIQQLDWRFWSALISAFSVLVVMSPFLCDVNAGAVTSLIALFALGLWWLWAASPFKQGGRVVGSAAFVVIALFLGFGIWWFSQPHFEITALDTLEGDPNAYELTDMLIWNQDNLDQFGGQISFSIEVRPIYYGKQNFGKVVAIIGGEGEKSFEKVIWDNFDSTSPTRPITLTLTELLGASGLQMNSLMEENSFRPGDAPFDQRRLTIGIARLARKGRIWSRQHIVVRNAPWEFRAELVEQGGSRQVYGYVRNLGAPGEFTVRYRLVRLDKEIEADTDPTTSGITQIASGNEPRELQPLGRGDWFTPTAQVPKSLMQGRYLLEVYAIKKQNYVRFANPNATWENCNSLDHPWWLARSPFEKLIFVETRGFTIKPIVQAELDRLHDNEDIELGLATGPMEEMIADDGKKVLRQPFQQGEMVVVDDQAYAIYGLVWELYQELGGAESGGLAYPLSQIDMVMSSGDVEAQRMTFVGLKGQMPSVIYVSAKGAGLVEGWIARVYAETGGHEGWLGLPIARMKYTADSTFQPYEFGYIVYYYPLVNGERDWNREPVAQPYLAGRGTLMDVHAGTLWQDTGIDLKEGEQVTVIQVGGQWSQGPDEGWIDANGLAEAGIHEDMTMPSAFGGLLIGRVGEGESDVLPIGRWHTFAAPSEGRLYLAMNDCEYDDNEGYITVQIIVEQ